MRLCANASASVGFLPERLKAFQARYPHVQIALTEQISDEVVRTCLDGRADIGISASGRMPGGLDSWPFADADDPLMVVLPLGHALTESETLAFAEVLRYPLVALQESGSLDLILKEHADAARPPLRLAVTVNSFDAQCRMVEAGLGIGIVPISAASAFAGSHGFVRWPLAEPWAAARSLRVHALKISSRLMAVQALIDALTER
ncbi:Transcriptional regulator, LysR family [Candidatus Burkholderia brachyanthoides]|nr:Transcriptional regulator, LysR family [Candidatus Burkholderia brachyanthoides]